MAAEGGGRRRRRVLSTAEAALWRLVTDTVEPLAAPRRAPEPDAVPVPPPPAPPPPDEPARPETGAAAPKPEEKRATRPKPLAPIDAREMKRVARQPFPAAAKLDLHGMTQAAAHRRLVAFVTEAQRDDVRMVLVITGKGSEAGGDPLSHGRGVLKRVVPGWLAAAELRSVVLGFSAARPEHGGTGALYVRLRRIR